MLKVKTLEVAGMLPALHGMRNPYDSWNKSDSKEGCVADECPYNNCNPKLCDICESGVLVGTNDADLATRLIGAGPEHRKFMRQIQVWFDITAPMYFYKELDTYKIATVRNSTSTMHKIASKRFEREDFSIEHIHNLDEEHWMVCMDNVIASLNTARDLYLKTKDKKYWWQMVQLLPSSYNQTSTMMMNYEVLYSIYHQRAGHKLDEWQQFRDWIGTLPHSWMITQGAKR